MIHAHGLTFQEHGEAFVDPGDFNHPRTVTDCRFLELVDCYNLADATEWLEPEFPAAGAARSIAMALFLDLALDGEVIRAIERRAEGERYGD